MLNTDTDRIAFQQLYSEIRDSDIRKMPFYKELNDKMDMLINQRIIDRFGLLYEEIQNLVHFETQRQNKVFTDRMQSLQSFCIEEITQSIDFLNS